MLATEISRWKFHFPLWFIPLICLSLLESHRSGHSAVWSFNDESQCSEN